MLFITNTEQTSRCYFYVQVLTQMAATRLEVCDFFVRFLDGNHCEVVFFNVDVWHSVKNKVDKQKLDIFL